MVRRSRDPARFFLFDPALGPGADRADDLAEGLAAFGESVGYADGAVGGDRAGDQAFALQLPEALGEEAVGEAGDGGEDLVEAGGAGNQDAQNGADPAAADQLDRVLEARAEGAEAVVRVLGAWLGSSFTKGMVAGRGSGLAP